MIICKENTLALKGLCILIIVAHHYAQNFGFLPDFLRGFGAIGCAVFFFISGYGLTKGPGDFKKWKNRFFRLYFPFFIANSLYLLYFIFGEKRSFGLLSGTKYLIGIPMTNIYWLFKYCLFCILQVLLLILYSKAVITGFVASPYCWGGIFLSDINSRLHIMDSISFRNIMCQI